MLTVKQKKLFEFIKNFILEHSCSPTHREIKEALNITSFSYLNKVLDKLEKLQLIERKNKGERCNIGLLQSPYTLPLLGRIAAGSPIEAIAEPEELLLTQSILGENRYLLKVKGDSMIEENICDGDLVICERCQEVSNGTIVVALIRGQEATLKRFYYEQDKIYLKPANKSHSVQIYRPDEVEIQGKFIGLIRLNI